MIIPTPHSNTSASRRTRAMAALRSGHVTNAILAAATGGTSEHVARLKRELFARTDAASSTQPIPPIEI